MFSMQEISRLYRVEVGDMGEQTSTLDDLQARRRGVLLCGGAGLMMSTLDRLPLRYFVDADTYVKGPDVRLQDAMQMWAHYHPPLIVMGWYTTRVPVPVLEGCRAVAASADASSMIVYSGGGLNEIAPGQFTDLKPFCRRVHADLARSDK